MWERMKGAGFSVVEMVMSSVSDNWNNAGAARKAAMSLAVGLPYTIVRRSENKITEMCCCLLAGINRTAF
jgi:hypothetical protein